MSPARKLKKLVVPDDSIGIIEEGGLEAYAREVAEEVIVHRERPTTPESLLEKCRGADGVVNILATSVFTREVLEQCPGLRIISIWAAGVNNIDLDAAKELGVTITNTPGYGSFGVGEHTLALMLATARNMVNVDRLVREGQWMKDPLVQLYGKSLGVVGAGAIAQRVMELGRSVGMKVVAWTLHPSPERAAEYGVEFVGLDELCRSSDFIAVIIALSERTHHVIGREQLELMKPEAIVVNTGRGALIDEDALVEVLSQKRIKGAGLDVFTTEPLPKGHPLTKLDNVVLSSHVAAHTPETTQLGVRMALDNIRNFLDGNPTSVFPPGSR